MNKKNLSLSYLKSDCNRYELIRPLGRGKYSDVYEGTDPIEKRKVIVKLLKPVRKAKIGREISILQKVYGGPHIIKLYDICRDVLTGTPALIFEHFSSDTVKKIKNPEVIHIQKILY